MRPTLDGNDLPERLRQLAKEMTQGDPVTAAMLISAAKEIERLRHDLARGMANHNADLNYEQPSLKRRCSKCDRLTMPDKLRRGVCERCYRAVRA